MSDDALPDSFDQRPLPSASPARPGHPLGDWAMALVLWVPWTWKRRSTFLKFFEGARQLTVNAGVFVLGLILVIVVVRATPESIVIVDPIPLPKDFEKEGYSPTILAQHLIDRVQRIGEQADTLKQKTKIGSESRYAALASIQVPEAGFSVRSVISALRDVAGIPDNRISGDLTMKTPEPTSKNAEPVSRKVEPAATTPGTTSRYVLSLRMDGPQGRKLEAVDGASVAEVLEKAALVVTERIDPYTLGLYLIGREKMDDAERVAISLISSRDPEARKWGHYLSGQIAIAYADHQEAIREFEAATRLDENFVPAMVGHGYVLATFGEFAKAEALTIEAQKRDPNYGPAYVLWGILLFRKGERDEALAKFHHLPQRDPRPLYSKTMLALAYLEANEPDRSLRTCKEAIALNPTYAVAYSICGMVHQHRGELAEAAAMFQKAIELGNRPSLNHMLLGQIATSRNDHGNALEMYVTATRLNPKNLDIHLNVAATLVQLQRYDEAILIVWELLKQRDEPRFKDLIIQYREWQRPF
jgi:tetratricopeptide (TPR) repeat protein